MKRIRGFGYVEPGIDREDEAEEREEDRAHDEWVQGFIEAFAQPDLEVKDYTCPRCKRFLFAADVSLHGVIFIRCRKCRREVAITTKLLMQRIGYIDTDHKTKEGMQ